MKEYTPEESAAMVEMMGLPTVFCDYHSDTVPEGFLDHPDVAIMKAQASQRGKDPWTKIIWHKTKNKFLDPVHSEDPDDHIPTEWLWNDSTRMFIFGADGVTINIKPLMNEFILKEKDNLMLVECEMYAKKEWHEAANEYVKLVYIHILWENQCPLDTIINTWH